MVIFCRTVRSNRFRLTWLLLIPVAEELKYNNPYYITQMMRAALLVFLSIGWRAVRPKAPIPATRLVFASQLRQNL